MVIEFCICGDSQVPVPHIDESITAGIRSGILLSATLTTTRGTEEDGSAAVEMQISWLRDLVGRIRRQRPAEKQW